MATAVYPNIEIAQTAKRSTNAGKGLITIYEWIKNVPSKLIQIILFPFAFIGGGVLIYLINVWIKLGIKAIEVLLRENLNITPENYTALRKEYDKWEDVLHSTKEDSLEFIQAKSENIWLLSKFASNCLLLREKIEQRQLMIKIAFDSLDHPESGDNYKVLTSDDLWEGRCKAYDYVL